MSGNNATIANDGAPQVSILADASMKRCQERRRQSRLLKNSKGMGVGKKYPSVGTHHRSTKHVWQLSELAELSAAYKAHHATMPCWNIANMLYYSFGEQLRHVQEQEQDQNADDQQTTSRTHLPTIQAIQAKLMDCNALQYADTFGYAFRPTQTHKQVWEHLELAEKHRELLKGNAAVQLQQQDDNKQKSLAPIWNVHPTSFYTPHPEIQAAEPPTKRRKIDTTQQQQQQQQQQPIEPSVVIEELSSLLEDMDQVRRREKAILQKFVDQIREHNTRIEQLRGSMQCAEAEIEQHRQAITRIIERIAFFPCESMGEETSDADADADASRSATMTMTTTSPTPTSTPVCAKCTRKIEGGLGGFSVCYADPSHPEHGTIACDDCAPMSPSSRAYFEHREAEDAAEYAERMLANGVDRCAINSDSDDWEENPAYGSGYGYDHSEECS